MSREIKFRAWDYEIGKVVDLYEVILGDEYQYYEDDNENLGRCKTETLMQYTGLKDKNGVEIYEGDALRCYHEDGESNYAGVVEWIAEGDWLGWCLMDGCGPEMLRVDDQGNLGVIGNIHENPELLEEKE